MENASLILTVIGLALGLVAVIQSRGNSITGWGIVALAAALLV